jgi:O-antigen ligase
VLGATGLALTLSRGAWVSGVLTFALFFWLAVRARLLTRQRLGRILLRVALAAVVFAAVFGSAMSDRLLNSSSGNVDVRFELNKIALAMIAAHPFAGVGLNNFTVVMPEYDPSNVMRYFPAPVHNLYLLEGAEAGVPAVWLFLALFVAILNTSRQRLAVVSDAKMRWLAVAIIASLVGFLFSQVADFSYRLEPLRSIVWMQVGVLFGAVWPRRHAERTRESPLTNRW